MNNSRKSAFFGLLFALVSEGSLATTQPGLDVSLDTVVVEGTSATPGQMRAGLAKLEDRFYERYNALNTIRDFDMQCTQEAPTGTRFAVRNCRAVYAIQALQAEGQEDTLYRNRMNFVHGELVIIGSPPPPAVQTIEARSTEFQRNMRDVILRNPELLSLLRERDELGRRYKDATRKATQGGA